jgi:hypothetical protein
MPIYQNRYHLVVALLLGTFLLGCSGPQVTSSVPNEYKITNSEFADTIEKYTVKAKKYDGFQNVFSFSSTLLNAKTRSALLRFHAKSFQWSLSRIEKEERADSEAMATKTQVFLSFFTPEEEHNDLSKKKSMWEIFLDVGGQRYPGKAKKLRDKRAKIQQLFPHHTRWGTAYEVTFLVPTDIATEKSPRLVITGPLGGYEVQFKE